MLRLKTYRLRQHKKKILRFKKYRQENCLNCGRPLGKFDRFCVRCGQKNSKKKLNLLDLLREFLSSLFAYDSRIQNTFKAIFTSPGKIAKEYIAGKRVKYVNPFRFFIFIAVVFFLLVSWLMPYDDIYKTHKSNDIDKEKVITEPIQTDSLSADSFQKEDEELKVKLFKGNLYEYFKKNGYKTFKEVREETELKDEFLDWLKYKYLLSASLIEEQPADFIRFLIPKIPFFIFFFLPIFTLFSKLFYIRRNFTYTEHLVFNFYEQSVFMLIFFIDLLIVNYFEYDAASASLFLFFIYNTIAMKKFYEQGYLKTVVKFLLLGFSYFFLFLIIISTFTIFSVAFYR